jgi:hypothetical protein
MKRNLYLIAFLVLSVVLPATGFAQVLKNHGDAPVRNTDKQQPEMTSPLKGGGDIIWQTSFNWKDTGSPTGWRLPEGWEVKDNSDLGNGWIWRDDSLHGLFSDVGIPAHFATPGDGYLCVPMDEYNSRDGIDTENVIDTYIVTPPIDCSSASSVMVKFNQEFRLCCSNYNIEMLVTNDAGVHWASYEIRFGIRGNTVTPPKFQSPEINISDVAAGLKNVQIKFYIHGMARYYMMIDDLKLVEAFSNDLVLTESWTEFNAGFDATIGHLNYLPYTQIGMASEKGGKIGDFQFRGAFLNNGMADQEEVALNTSVLRDGVEVYNKTSTTKTIWPLERDTLTITDPLSPADYGDYKINLKAISANAEEVPANNSATVYFTVNDTLFQRADLSAEAGISSGAWSGGGRAGDVMAISYDVQAPCEVNSISAYLTRITETGTPTLQFVLFRYMAAEDDYAEVMTSEIIDFDLTRERSRITLPLSKDGESEFLQPGEYLAGVRTWGSDGTDGLDIGWDLSTKFPSGYSLCYQVSDNGWAAVDKLTMIGFNLNAQGGPTQASVTFNVDMTLSIASGDFKPGTDLLDVTGLASTWSGTAVMSDPDGNGIYTVTVEGLQIAGNLNYLYRINGNPEPFPANQNPFRNYTVRYWNIVNNTINTGAVSGTDPIVGNSTFTVYPNPTTGTFNLAVNNGTASDLEITLTNIQGQVVYRNRVEKVASYQETIGGKLSKGMYFLSVRSGKEVRVEKVIIN